MSELTPDLLDGVMACCRDNAANIAAALAGGMDTEVQVSVGEPSTYGKQAMPQGVAAAGLVFVMQAGDMALAALLPEASGLVQDWMREPDSAGTQKLHALAQQLSKFLLPATIKVDQFAAAWTNNLSQSLADAEAAEGAVLLPLVLDADDSQSHLTLVWPCAAGDKLLLASHRNATRHHVEQPADATPPSTPPRKPQALTLEELPPYCKHLLKISVPVSVRLVSKKLSIKEVLELGPGAMVSFDKSCDGPLDLAVGDQVIAVGAAVKVGERFGLEIEKMTLPVEQFWPVRKTG